MVKVTVHVKVKEGVINPEASALERALAELSFDEVKSVTTGKTIELEMESTESLDTKVKEMCEQLLVNTVIEDYSYTVEEENKA
ncbi:phosphoribosylformylglycinamidine synthase subunit PurS [Aliibacillus thermotolerans]|uniref:Phosphoribosylformylglycinamidine synthase subunit PurS n=1 Tax=Aliibacillus thermotolerans TaxID=1834418 RepID=A0ABW0U6J2_9BACI|nr:phosphoribosylformylglycinamidine synthase subunit PurS [Aliibacillus thermotolerans]MDA3130406.1 phosphoribosylformylglycinamidine synthase subunit PurS [Aliibacillus thermotolerans]